MILTCWLLVVLSSCMYGAAFLLHEYLWWLVFIFPVPLCYAAAKFNLSFWHGYVWAVVVLTLHLGGAISVILTISHEWWLVGLIMVILTIVYQALCAGIIFLVMRMIIYLCSIKLLLVRLMIYAAGLWLFIVWVDWYSMWIFGLPEGYPLMHPFVVLAYKRYFLYLLPLVGKTVLMSFFLLVPISLVLVLCNRNCISILFFCTAMIPWVFSWGMAQRDIQCAGWYKKIKSLPIMMCFGANQEKVVIKLVANQLKNILIQYPETEVVIMPESAFNINNFNDLSSLINQWDYHYVGKPIHLIFGASRWHQECYYNSFHWVHNGALQHCSDKRHAMFLSERLFGWMNNVLMRQIYFNQSVPIAISFDERMVLPLLHNRDFVPYICSELFFNEFPDDDYKDVAIIVIVNDSLFLSSYWSLYIQKLLVLLARYKAVYWQRDIVYVSYAQSLFIDKNGMVQNINT